jgi:hypothetical protein
MPSVRATEFDLDDFSRRNVEIFRRKRIRKLTGVGAGQLDEQIDIVRGPRLTIDRRCH